MNENFYLEIQGSSVSASLLKSASRFQDALYKYSITIIIIIIMFELHFQFN